MVNIEIQPLHPALGQAIGLPQQMSALAAGYDVAAALDEPVVLKPGERRLVPCGFAMAIPPGYECQVRPRSGLAIRHGITLLNAPGTIDADYRGEVKVILINLGDAPFTVEPGERIAQLVFAPTVATSIDVVTTLSPTARGEGGFGSTG